MAVSSLRCRYPLIIDAARRLKLQSAIIDFERFMAGDTPDHVIAYCRRAVSAERESRPTEAP
jgi:hypothetical protein